MKVGATLASATGAHADAALRILKRLLHGFAGAADFRLWNDSPHSVGQGPPAFKLVLRDPMLLRSLVTTRGPVLLADACFSGQIDVQGIRPGHFAKQITDHGAGVAQQVFQALAGTPTEGGGLEWKHDAKLPKQAADTVERGDALLDEPLAARWIIRRDCCSRFLIGTKRMCGRWMSVALLGTYATIAKPIPRNSTIARRTPSARTTAASRSPSLDASKAQAVCRQRQPQAEAAVGGGFNRSFANGGFRIGLRH